MPLRKWLTPFCALNIAQFCTSINDNLFKILLVFYLISLQGLHKSYTILALAGAIFVLPFLLFATTAGCIADRYSKRKVIYYTRAMEVVITLWGVICFYFEWVFASYSALFLLALQSTIFSPCKYGIIPEICKKEKISHYNGIITASTYLAIIFGTFAASFLTLVTDKHFVLASTSTVVIAIIGAIAALWLPRTYSKAPEKKISFDNFGGIVKSLQEARKTRYLFVTVAVGAYFLFMGAFLQLNMIPFVTQSLGFSDIQGGFLFLIVAMGIGLGSFAAGQLCRDEVELGFLPLSAFVTAICFFSLYLFASHFFLVSLSLLVVGIAGGFYIVPVDIFIQLGSPESQRGQNLATANFLSFVGVVSASFLLALFGNILKLTSAQGFLILSFFTFALTLLLIMLYTDQLLRLLVFIYAKLFCKLRILGKRRLLEKPLIIVGQRQSWLDIMIIMASLPRLIRYIVPVDEETRRHRFYYLFLKVIPLDIEAFSPLASIALEQIKAELAKGHCVCIMQPAQANTKNMKEWREEVQQWLQGVDIPALPVHIKHQGLIDTSSRWKQFLSLIGSEIVVGFGTPINES